MFGYPYGGYYDGGYGRGRGYGCYGFGCGYGCGYGGRGCSAYRYCCPYDKCYHYRCCRRCGRGLFGGYYGY